LLLPLFFSRTKFEGENRSRAGAEWAKPQTVAAGATTVLRARQILQD
jgi:hypothetical protein